MRPSSAQTRLWYLQQLSPGDCSYLIAEAFHLHGQGLNLEALQQGLQRVVERHEPFRMHFRESQGEPEVWVDERTSVEIPVEDLTSWPAADRVAEAERRIAARARQPFDLTGDLLIRAVVYRLDADEHVLGLVTHHIAVDGWSMGNLRREWSGFYDAAARSVPVQPLPLLATYADYARDQVRRQEAGELEAQFTYWETQLAGLDPALGWTDFRRPPTPRHQGATVPFEFPAAVLEGLTGLAREQGVTVFMLLLAGWKALLYRHGLGEDIAVGCPVAARYRPEYDPLIGFFANTLVMRTRLDGGASFRLLLNQVRETVLEGLRHQDVPFDQLVERLRPERALGRTPFFSTALAFHNADSTELSLGELAVTRRYVHAGTSKFDVLLLLEDASAGLSGYLEYDTDLYRRESIERLGKQYLQLLAAAAENPDCPLDELRIVTERERAALILDRNETGREFPDGPTVAELFAVQARRRPLASALDDGRQRLTYAELEAEAEVWAERFRRAGVQPRQLVGLRMDRCTAMVAAILGVFKAGAAYVPIDPAYPARRKAYLLETSRAVVVVEADGRIEPTGVAQAGIGPPGIAYVMFTSGSTGTPKGVMVPHRAIARLVFGQEYLEFGGGETFLHLSSISFDASTLELWGALLHGAKLALAPGSTVPPDELGGLISTHGVTTLWLTGTYFNAVLDEDPSALRPLRQLIIGGEALSTAHVRRALELLPNTRIVNGYGPTECTTFACCHELPRELDARALSVPIGRPIANTRAYVLDRCLQPVPEGVPGELYLAGAGLAYGYWDQPELTRQRFVPDPFADQPGDRMYATGDLVRWLPGGELEFLSRLDRQVKIRGYRIEPGEVESALREYPAVRDAVVRVQANDSGGMLAAYVAVSQTPVDEAAIRAFLRERLPAHLIPQLFLWMDTLPYTANGKVDLDRLPRAAVSSVAHLPEPADEVEKRLLGLFRQVLKMPELDVSSDFFASGGHSLMAAKLMALIERDLGKRLPLVALFQAPTVQELARRFRSAPGVRRFPAVVLDESGGGQLPFYCVDTQVIFRSMALEVARQRPFVTLPVDGYPDCFPYDVAALARYHVAQIREHQPRGPYAVGGWSLSGTVALEVVRQLRAAGEEVLAVVLFDTLNYVNAPEELSMRRLRFRWRRVLAGEVQFSRKITERVQAYWHRWRDRWAGQQANVSGDDPVPVTSRIPLLAAQRYVPSNYEGRMILVQSEEVAASFSDPMYGWSKVVSGPLEIRTIAGNHTSMFEPENAQALAGIIQSIYEPQAELQTAGASGQSETGHRSDIGPA